MRYSLLARRFFSGLRGPTVHRTAAADSQRASPPLRRSISRFRPTRSKRSRRTCARPSRITSGPTLHHGITTVFAYSPDSQWTVYCQPLRVTEIQLSPDEHAKKNGVDIGDSARWGVEIGDQVVMVKPLADASNKNMTTNW